MGTHLLNKSLVWLMWICLNSGCDNWTNQWTVSLYIILNVGSEMHEPKSVIKTVEYNSLLEVSHMIAFPNTSIWTQDNMTAFIAFRLHTLRRKSFMIYEKRATVASTDCSNFHFNILHKIHIKWRFCSLKHMGWECCFICKCFMPEVPNPVPGDLSSCKVQLQPWSNTAEEWNSHRFGTTWG